MSTAQHQSSELVLNRLHKVVSSSLEEARAMIGDFKKYAQESSLSYEVVAEHVASIIIDLCDRMLSQVHEENMRSVIYDLSLQALTMLIYSKLRQSFISNEFKTCWLLKRIDSDVELHVSKDRVLDELVKRGLLRLSLSREAEELLKNIIITDEEKFKKVMPILVEALERGLISIVIIPRGEIPPLFFKYKYVPRTSMAEGIQVKDYVHKLLMIVNAFAEYFNSCPHNELKNIFVNISNCARDLEKLQRKALIIFHPSGVDEVLSTAIVMRCLESTKENYILRPAFSGELAKVINEYEDEALDKVFIVGVPIDTEDDKNALRDLLQRNRFVRVYVYWKRRESFDAVRKLKEELSADPEAQNRLISYLRMEADPSREIMITKVIESLARSYRNVYDDKVITELISTMANRDAFNEFRKKLSSVLNYFRDEELSWLMNALKELGVNIMKDSKFEDIVRRAEEIEKGLKVFIKRIIENKDKNYLIYIGERVVGVKIPREFRSTRRAAELLSRLCEDKIAFAFMEQDDNYLKFSYRAGRRIEEWMRSQTFVRLLKELIRSMLHWESVGGGGGAGGGTLPRLSKDKLELLLKGLDESLRKEPPD